MKSSISIFLISLASILFLCGCTKGSIPVESNLPADASLAEAKAFWLSQHITQYTMEQTAESWYPWSHDTVRVRVVSDTVYSVISLRTNSEVNSLQWMQYKTVNQLFEIAEQDTSDELVNRESGPTAHVISWELDSTYGYPKVLYYELLPPPRTEGRIKIITHKLSPD